MYVSAIIPAAGVGKRLQKKGETLPKQFWPLGSRLIMEHVCCVLERAAEVKEVIICCAPQYKKIVSREIIEKNGLKKVRAIIAGGAMRADTVLKGIKKVSPQATHLLVQDAVRPFLSEELLSRMINSLKGYDGVIAARPVSATIKKVKGKKINATVDRSQLWEAETPQIFSKKMLLKAYTTLKRDASLYTDEASLVEAVGGAVRVVDSQTCNMKVTTRADYALAQKLMEGSMTKVGFGYDIHRLIEERDLIIGGVKIPFSKGPLGHSDGDPLLHAIIDAILGAAALGDIGELFPDTDPQLKDSASSTLLQEAVLRAQKKGFSIDHIDATIILERPKLSLYKPKIKKKLQSLLSLATDQVNVKAKTKEGLDSEGAGGAVSAYAAVTLVKNGN